MKCFCGVMMLACSGAVALAGNNAPYPQEKVAAFVVEKLHLTTLGGNSPQTGKGKKTFGDYGYATRQADEKEALVEAAPGAAQVGIRTLEQEASGIYVCADHRGRMGATGTSNECCG